MEITEINNEIDRLRRRRSHLFKQQQKLTETIKQSQQTTTARNLNEQWERTGNKKKWFIHNFIVFYF